MPMNMTKFFFPRVDISLSLSLPSQPKLPPPVYRRPAVVHQLELAPMKATSPVSPRQEARPETINEEAVRAR